MTLGAPSDPLDRVEALMRQDEELQRQLRDLESTPPSPAPDPDREAAKGERSGLATGAVALLLALLALPFVAALPSGLLLVDVGLAWGTVSWVRLLVRTRRLRIDDAVIASLLPAMAIPSLARFLAAGQSVELPSGLGHTLAFSALLVAAVTGAAALAGPRRWVVQAFGFGGLAGAVALLLLIALLHPSPPVGAWPTLGLTLATVAAAVTAQSVAARAARGAGWKCLACAPALGLAAAQLLDGTVSYLAVANPLGLLAQASHEQVWLSALLIEWTGPGYVLVKWGLAIVLVRVLDGPGIRTRVSDPVHRLGLYLLMAYISMGPAIYSTVGLFR